MNKQLVLLEVGRPYPDNLSVSEGAISDFLRPSVNRLIIAMPNISAIEEKGLRKGVMRGGMLAKNGAILFVWQFYEKGKLTLSLDSPFDARVIHDIQFYDITTSETRLAIEVHIVDSATKIIKGLRFLTMPPGMTIEFLSAVQDQLANPNSGDDQWQKWMAQQPFELAKRTQMWLMGG